MSRSQLIFLIASLLIFIVLAFVFDTSSSEQERIQQMRKATGSKISVANIERRAFADLSPAQKEEMRLLYKEIDEKDSVNVELYKQIAGKWFNFAAPEMSGVFAEKVAQITDTDSSWAIAGSTYYLALQNISKEDRLKDFCLEKAKKCFDNAISLAPKEMDYKISRAQVEIDFPPEDNPMKGVQLLLSLNREYPNDPKINLRLAKLGVQTGQWEKALKRLEKVLELQPQNNEVHCLLSRVYAELDQIQQASKFRELCNSKN